MALHGFAKRIVDRVYHFSPMAQGNKAIPSFFYV
jgi:hypothetical protein